MFYCFRSNIFKQVLDQVEYREGQQKRIEMKNFSKEAVQQFLKFLYRFELEEGEDWKNDLEFIKELIVLGGAYSVSDFQTAASSYLANHLNAVNSLELGEFAAAHNAEAAAEMCKKVLSCEEPQSVVLPLAVIDLMLALSLLSYMYGICIMYIS